MSGNENPDFSETLAVGWKLDLKLPDSGAVRDAYTQAQAESPLWLFNHLMRSWFFGAKLAQRRALSPDAELVAVAVLLHDLGLARGGILLHGSVVCQRGVEGIRGGPAPDPGQSPCHSKRTKIAVITSRSSGTE